MCQRGFGFLIYKKTINNVILCEIVNQVNFDQPIKNLEVDLF